MNQNSSSEQLEEGEIVDDDFEDISDNSIIDSAFGKFVTSNEHLRALSLSSDSDSEKFEIVQYKKILHRKCKIKQRKRHKRTRYSTSDSSDSDTSPPEELKGKLKEAIRIDDIDVKEHINPLENRLKAMGGLGGSNTPISVPSSKDENTDEKSDDMELENLRLEALKTAVINKCQRRKRKKALLEGQDASAPLEKQENKENNTPKDEPSDTINNGQNIVSNPVDDLEEDEDLLRASLLAGLAKKITKEEVPTENPLQIKQVLPKVADPVQTILPKRPMNKFKNIINKRIPNKQIINNTNKVIQKINIPKPQVKPLIINVNADSDSEEDLKKSVNSEPKTIAKVTSIPKPPVNKAPKETDLKSITSNVEKFLKEQRAKFETETKTKLQDNVSKDKPLLEKSAVKLLPKSQQIEYQLLMRKLKNAERRKRAKKLALERKKSEAVKTDEISVESKQSEEISQDKSSRSNGENNSTKEASKSECSCCNYPKSSKECDFLEKKRSGITNELTILQKTLKEIKMQKNGSLQIKSKYQMLTPIIRKITAISNERKKQEYRIKTLMQELNEARRNLTKSHDRFSSLVKELVSKKEQIDESTQEKKLEITDKDNNNQANSEGTTNSLPVTSTPIKSLEEVDETSITFNTSSNNDCEDMDVCNSDENDACQIDIVDPNDIDQIFKRKPPIKPTIPEYISPLNFNVPEKYRNVDPYGIMCPYEVHGSCRDNDCAFKHYLKIHERL